MKYDTDGGGGRGANEANWSKSVPSPPSSRYGDVMNATTESVTSRRARRSRLAGDIGEFSAPRNPRTVAENVMSSTPYQQRYQDYRNQLNHTARTDYMQYQNQNDSFSTRYSRANPMFADYFSSRRQSDLTRRPRSSYSEKIVQRDGRRSVGPTVYDKHPVDGSNFSSSDDQEVVDSESDEEVRNYQEQARRAHGSKSATLFRDQFIDGGEAYFFGVVHLDLEMVGHIMKTMPPPHEYYELPPIEKAAYLFYSAVYKKHYRSVDEFHKRFNREFYKYVCSGDNNDLALFKICKSMQEEFRLRQLEASKKAMEEAERAAEELRKLDFNKDGEAPVDVDDVESIVAGSDVFENGPVKFPCSRAFLTFGSSGKVVVVRPPTSRTAPSTVVVEDVKQHLQDDQSARVMDTVHSFKGPLIAGQTPSHSVRLFIQRQIDSLKEKRNTTNVADVEDALLVWQLLDIMVQQQTSVKGTDIAALLTASVKNLPQQPVKKFDEVAEKERKEKQAAAFDKFTQFLLGGHVDEALETAMQDGLYGYALYFAKKVLPYDEKRITAMEQRFLSLRAADDPLTSLISVASQQLPPVLMNLQVDGPNCWRRHAAIILANLQTPVAANTIYQMGLALAKRERHCAADFCLLAVCLLEGYDPFHPIQSAEGEEVARKYITLIHSGLAELDPTVQVTCGENAVCDLHVTEVYDYALKLCKNGESPLARSTHYQLARLDYVKMISSYGGFSTEAFRYCMEVARSIWPYWTLFQRENLEELCELAEKLQHFASANADETQWIPSLRAMISGEVLPVAQQQYQEVNHEKTPEHQHQEHPQQQPEPVLYEPVQPAHYEPEPVYEPPAPPAPPPVAPPQQYNYQQPTFEFQQQQQYQEQNYEQQTTVQPESAPQSTLEDDSEKTLTRSTDSEVTTPSTTSTLEPPPPPPAVEVAPLSFVPTPPIQPPQEQKWTPSPPVSTLTSMPPPSIRPPVADFVPAPPPPPPVAQTTPTIPMPTNSFSSDGITSPAYLTPASSPPTGPPVPAAVFEQPHPPSPKTELQSLWDEPAPSVTKSTTAPQPAQTNHLQQPPQQQQQQQQQQKESDIPRNASTSSKKGWFGFVKDKVRQSIDPSAMKLPDDSKPSIVWDPVKKRYVGEGVEEEEVAAPPPAVSALGSMPTLMDSSSTASLRSLRSTGGSRYKQAAPTTTSTAAAPMAPGVPTSFMPPAVPLPASFGFMPAPVDDSESVDPFSGEAQPTINQGSAPANE